MRRRAADLLVISGQHLAERGILAGDPLAPAAPMPDTRTPRPDLVVPGIIPLTYLGYAADQGLDALALLREAGLRVDSTAAVAAGLPMSQMERLINVMLAKLGDARLGFEIGWRLPPTAFGAVGQAMLASATLGDALRAGQRYWPLIGGGLSLQVSIEGDTCVLDFVPTFPVPEVFRRLMLEAALAGVARAIGILAPTVMPLGEGWFDFPEPSYAPALRERVPALRWGMPATQVRAPAAALSTPLPMANAPGLQAAIEQCERELAMLALPGRLSPRVQQALRLGPDGYPSLEDVAARLHLSPRTLRRRLADEGTGFAALLEEARCRDAQRLLANAALDVQQVAARLGYAEPANFTRAFRKWTGQTPSGWRAQRPAGS